MEKQKDTASGDADILPTKTVEKGSLVSLYVISWFDSAHHEAPQYADLIKVNSLHPERSRRVTSCTVALISDFFNSLIVEGSLSSDVGR